MNKAFRPNKPSRFLHKLMTVFQHPPASNSGFFVIFNTGDVMKKHCFMIGSPLKNMGIISVIVPVYNVAKFLQYSL